MATPLRQLSRKMRERVIKALLLGLPTQLNDDLRDEGLQDVGPIPAASDYWDTPAPQVANISLSNVLIAISHTQQTQYQTRLSGDDVTGSVIVRARVSVICLLRQPAGYPELIKNDRVLTQTEVLELLADIYRGAILEVVLRDAVDGAVILEVFPMSDYADTITPDVTDEALGRAVIEFEISGQGTHPAPSYALER